MNILENILDTGSFSEQGNLIKNADVTCGYGTISDQLVFVYQQFGHVTNAHAKKIAAIYNKALSMGAPVIGVLNAQGIKLEDGLNTLDAHGIIYRAMSKAKGVVPQISIITGSCMGVSSFIPSLSDFIFTIGKETKWSLQSPTTWDDTSKDNYDNIVHFECENMQACSSKLKELLELIPQNNLTRAFSVCTDDINRVDPSLSENSTLHEIFASISDNNKYFDVYKSSNSFITAFAKFNGITAGIIGIEDTLSLEMIRRSNDFIMFCNSFNIPIITFTALKGYLSTAYQDINIRYEAGRLIQSLVSASVGKVNIIFKESVGSGYLLFNSVHLGCDVTYAWENGYISLFEQEAAKKVLGVDTKISLEEIGQEGFLDNIIDKAQTRKHIIAALEMLTTKREYYL